MRDLKKIPHFYYLFKCYFPVFFVDYDLRLFADFARNEFRCKVVQNLFLNNPLDRSCAELRVVTHVGYPIQSLVRQNQFYVLVFQNFVDTRQLNFYDFRNFRSC